MDAFSSEFAQKATCSYFRQISAQNPLEMIILDNFCRFCACKLDCSRRRNIFVPENSHLLKTALECIPLPMTAQDVYPNFTCYPCAYKLSDIAAFQSNGLSAVHDFDEYLARNSNLLEASIKIEFVDETEMDIVEGISPKLEIRSENEDEEVQCSQDENDKLSIRDLPYQLKKCVVKLTRSDANLIATEMIPATQLENLPSGVDEREFVETETFVSPGQKLYSCDHCLKSFSQRANLAAHARVHTGKPIQCQQCKKSFRRKDYLVSHARVHTGGKPFQCQQCKKSFRRKDYLVSHARIHTGEKPFQCEHCQKSYTSRQILDRHIRAHTGEKPFQCEQCKKSFNRKDYLVFHARIHTGEKPFQCEYCQKRFDEKNKLVLHIRAHTGEKPFQCEQCQKSYTCKVSLVRHIRAHTGEKPFQCQQCKKSFSRKGYLVSHARVHTGEKPFQCEQCQKSFSQKANLAAHARVHTGGKPFQCQQCKKSFSRKIYLVFHARIHIGEKLLQSEVSKKIQRKIGLGTAHTSLYEKKSFNVNIEKQSLTKH